MQGYFTWKKLYKEKPQGNIHHSTDTTTMSAGWAGQHRASIQTRLKGTSVHQFTI